MNRKSILKLLFLSVILLFYSSNEKKTAKEDKIRSKFFKERDRIAFVGNSITNMGMFHQNI